MSTETPESPGERAATPSSPPGDAAGASHRQPDPAQHEPSEKAARQRAQQVQARIEQGYHELEEQYDQARHQLRQANDTAIEVIRNNPAMCIFGAAGVGYVIGRLASRRWLT